MDEVRLLMVFRDKYGGRYSAVGLMKITSGPLIDSVNDMRELEFKVEEFSVVEEDRDGVHG